MLAKVDTDRSQNLAQAFRVSSIPDVKILKDGKIIDQFVGALPEKDIKKILDKFLNQVESAKSSEERINTKDKLLACFYYLPPEDEIVGEYRRKLSRLLF